MSAALLLWVLTCVLPLFLTLFFPEPLGMWKPLFAALTFVGAGFFITLLIGSMILASVYEKYRGRTQLLLEKMYLAYAETSLAPSRWEQMKAEKAAETWGTVPLPLKRKWKLVQAGIAAREATTSEVQSFTSEDLHIMAVLAGRDHIVPLNDSVLYDL